MLEKLTKKSGDAGLIKNILVLAGGTMIGYAINLGFLPILSRIYTPGQLGEYDLILSSGRFVMDAVGLGLLVTIMLPKEDWKAKQICQLIFACNLFFLGLLTFVTLVLFRKYPIFEVSFSYYCAVAMLAAYIFFYNIQSVYYSYANRMKLYKVLFWNPILSSTVNLSVSVILGIGGLGTAGYLFGTISSYIVCIIFMSFYVKPFHTPIELKDLKERLKEYKKIPLIQLPANIISTMGAEIPIQFLGRIFGTTVLGGYMMACRILSVPVSLLAVPINRVVYRAMAEKKNEGEGLGEFCFSIVEKNIKLAIIPIGCLILFSNLIIPFFLGEKWSGSSQYISILGFMYLLNFCSSCLSGTFVLMERQKTSLIMSMMSIVKYVLCFGLAWKAKLSVVATIILYTCVESVYHVINLYLCMKYTNYSGRKFWLFLGKYIIATGICIYMISIWIHL